LGVGLTRVRVVGAALVVDGRVLAARRVQPAGGWEFPGGKVEPGESDEDAIARECLEELAVEVRAVALLAAARDDWIELVLWQVALVSGVPVALHDHDELRWLAADELDSVGWLPVDRALLDVVRPLVS
jgi:8-oxo-dGTP diphosphatase